MLSLLSGRREPCEPTGAVLVRGSLLFAAAEATDRLPGVALALAALPGPAAPPAAGAELALAVVLQLLAPCWEPALLSRLTGR